MDALKLYILLAVILAVFLLALFTLLPFRFGARIFYGEKDPGQWGTHRLNALFVFFLFIAVVVVLLLIMDFRRGPAIRLANSEGFEMSVERDVPAASPSAIRGMEGITFFTDKDFTFFLKRPVHEGWNPPESGMGLRDYLERTGLETSRANLYAFLVWNPWQPFANCVFHELRLRPYDSVLNCLDSSLRLTEYGKLLRLCHSTRFVYGSPIPVQVKGPVSLDAGAQWYQANAGDSAIRSSPFYFSNYFNITVLDKRQVLPAGVHSALSGYFFNQTINLVTNVEKIIASEDHIIWTSSYLFKNVLYGDKNGFFRIQRWVRIIERNRWLYLIEMVYSPDTDAGFPIWNDMKNMFESVGIAETEF